MVNKIVLFSGLLFACFAGAVQDSSGKEEEREAMEIGGLVTVDYNVKPNALDNPLLEIGGVELGANVFINPDITASVVLLAESDLSAISIDQAVAAYQRAGSVFSFVFGQHYFNHGLLATHLISDPLILDAVEFAHPGITFFYNRKALTGGLGLTVIAREDSIPDNDYAGVANLDWAVSEESIIRISTLLSAARADVDLAATLKFGGLSLDVEGFSELQAPESRKKTGGGAAGLAYGILENLEIAFRTDGFSIDGLASFDTRMGLGLTFSLPSDIFAALEVAHRAPAEEEAFQEINIQVGLESTLKLPGFQRRTLTRN